MCCNLCYANGCLCARKMNDRYNHMKLVESIHAHAHTHYKGLPKQFLEVFFFQITLTILHVLCFSTLSIAAQSNRIPFCGLATRITALVCEIQQYSFLLSTQWEIGDYKMPEINEHKSQIGTCSHRYIYSQKSLFSNNQYLKTCNSCPAHSWSHT